MKKWIRFLIGILISGFCLWMVLKNFDFSQISLALQNANYGLLILAALIYIFAFLARTLRWKILLNPIVQIPFNNLFFILTMGYFFNNFLPARGGEFARAYAAGKEKKSSTSSIFGTIVVERLTDFFSLFILMAVTAHYFINQNFPLKKIAIILLIGVLFTVSILWFFKNKSKSSSTSNKYIRFIVDQIEKFSKGLSTLKSPKTLLAAASISIFIWFIEVGTAKLISHAFNLNLSFIHTLVLFVGIAIGVMIPAAPGYIGTYEFFAQKTLVLLGYQEQETLLFVLVLHFFQILLTSILGLPYILKTGTKPSWAETG